MLAIIGLGNPGANYDKTRHNVGFRVIDLMSRRYGIAVSRTRSRALVGEGLAGGQRIALVKPQTYMNLSGESVQDLMRWYELMPQDILIISDDIDLPPGSVRIRPHGGAGTHNGLRNIIQMTGSDRFPRIRIGVGAPPPQWDLKDWVLSGFGEDQTVMDEALRTAADAADCFITGGIDLAMNRFNKRQHAQPTV